MIQITEMASFIFYGKNNNSLTAWGRQGY